MENLHGNPLFIIEDADQPVIVLVKPEGLTGVCHVRFHKGAGIGVGLKITPECAPANPYPKAGKTRHGLLHSPLERLRVYRLSHKCLRSDRLRSSVPSEWQNRVPLRCPRGTKYFFSCFLGTGRASSRKIVCSQIHYSKRKGERNSFLAPHPNTEEPNNLLEAKEDFPFPAEHDILKNQHALENWPERSNAMDPKNSPFD